MSVLPSASDTAPHAPESVVDSPPFAPDDRSAAVSWPWWSAFVALLCALLMAALGLLVIDIVAALAGVSVSASSTPPGIEIAATVVQDAAFVGAALLFAGMFSKPPRLWQFGLQTTPAGRAAGLVALLYGSFLVFSALWAALLHLHGKEKLLDQLGANHNSALLVAAALLTCVLAPVCEEFLFRGYMFTALRNLGGVLPAAVVTGLVFGGVHAVSAPAVYLIPLAFLGFGLCLLYWRTGSLLPCIAAHALNNSIAFGSLENWDLRQIAALAAGALALLAVVALALRRAGLIAPGRSSHPPAPPAPAAA
jgi:membrane protease YdiL (CAAX protease family)